MPLSADVLVCPACRSLPAITFNDGFGRTRCTCSAEMPIVENVVVSNDRALQGRLLGMVRAGDRDGARAALLEKFARRVQWMQRLGIDLTYRRFIRHGALNRVVEGLNLTRLLEQMPLRLANNVAAASQWNSYLKHRFVAPWFQSPLALLGAVNETGLVLDAPCGMGHLAYVISKLIPQERIVCMDLVAPFVYSALKFFVPSAAGAFAHDMGQPLPLASAKFSLAYVFDSFQYIPSKEKLAQELLRIVQDDGIVSILHSPNPAFPSIYHAQAIKPLEHLDLFPGCDVRIYPTRYLVDSYFSGKAIDLTRRFSESEINDAIDVDVVVAKSPGVLREIPNLRERVFDGSRNIQLSEQYRMRRVSDEVIFEEDFPESLVPDYEQFPSVLPKRYAISATEVQWMSGRPRFSEPKQRDLLRRHILVDLPEKW